MAFHIQARGVHMGGAVKLLVPFAVGTLVGLELASYRGGDGFYYNEDRTMRFASPQELIKYKQETLTPAEFQKWSYDQQYSMTKETAYQQERMAKLYKEHPELRPPGYNPNASYNYSLAAPGEFNPSNDPFNRYPGTTHSSGNGTSQQAALSPQEIQQQVRQGVLDAYNNAKDLTHLTFYLQKGPEPSGSGALRANVSKMDSVLLDSDGYVTNIPGLSDTKLFKYDAFDKEIYSVVPADKIGSNDIATFQRNVLAIGTAVDNDPRKAQMVYDALHGADTNPTPETVVSALNAVSKETGLRDFEVDKTTGLINSVLPGGGKDRDGKNHRRQAGHLDELYNDFDPANPNNPNSGRVLLQNILGKGKSIMYNPDDGDIFAAPNATAADIAEFQRNAPALNAAREGHLQEAREIYNRIHYLDDLPTRTASTPAQAKAADNTIGKLTDLNAAFKAAGLPFCFEFLPPASFVDQGSVNLTDEHRNQIIAWSNGMLNTAINKDGKTVLALDPCHTPTADDIKSLALHKDDITKWMADPAVAVAGPAASAQDALPLSNRENYVKETAEAQIMLETLGYHVGKHGIDGKFGKIDGGDTGNALAAYVKGNPAQPGHIDKDDTSPKLLTDDKLRRLIETFQDKEKIAVTGSIDEATLNKIVEEKKNLKKHHVSVTVDVTTDKNFYFTANSTPNLNNNQQPDKIV